MGFGIFIFRSDSIYDDNPAERYQFPSMYLDRAQACVGDWVAYYEPTKVTEPRGYFAIAKVMKIIVDPVTPGMHIALIEPGTYLDFIHPVAFKNADGLVERGLLNENGRNSARAQWSVRPISATDFNRILALGLDEREPELPRTGYPLPTEQILNFSESPQDAYMPFPDAEERSRVLTYTNRIVRDRLFRRLVVNAYDKRCAITGLKLVNGGGRAEVDAAHIKPVEKNGPDILNNGIALSGTAHWMFDRGMIGLSDDLEILISRQANDIESIRTLINRTGRAIVPPRPYQRPNPHFLKWHRENCFKF